MKYFEFFGPQILNNKDHQWKNLDLKETETKSLLTKLAECVDKSLNAESILSEE